MYTIKEGGISVVHCDKNKIYQLEGWFLTFWSTKNIYVEMQQGWQNYYKKNKVMQNITKIFMHEQDHVWKKCQMKGKIYLFHKNSTKNDKLISVPIAFVQTTFSFHPKLITYMAIA